MPLNGTLTPSFRASRMPATWGRLSSGDPEAEIGSLRPQRVMLRAVKSCAGVDCERRQ
jgi:hypothetical protein